MRRLVLAVLAVAAVPAGIAVAESTGLKVTGGGQVIVDGETGSGDTIAFTAQQVDAPNRDGGFAAKGQLQVINRSAGTGQSQVRFHGIVTCIREFVPDEGPNEGERFVRFGGYQKVNGKLSGNRFTTDTQDNGEGLTNVEGDMIIFRRRNSGQPCDDQEQNTELRSTKLARGNVQEH